MKAHRVSLAAYRLLLHAYPRSFREDYQSELVLLLRDQLATEATFAGRSMRLGWAAAGILAHAPKEHMAMCATDVRYALRTWRRNPWFTLFALVTLALGIGVNSALFSVVHSVLLAGLPYGHASQLTRVWVSNPKQGFDHDVTSYPRFEDWKARSRTFEDFAGFTGGRAILNGVQEPLQLTGAAVTANFFRLMEITPIVGRGFEPADDQPGRPLVAVLGYGFWRRQFGGDTGVIGRQLLLNGLNYQVVGVLPESVQFPRRDLDVWRPLIVESALRQDRRPFWLNAIGRLKPGVTLAQAQAEMDSIARALRSEHVVDRNLGVSLVGLKEDLVGSIRPALLVLSGAVALVLLICCASVAGMLAARAADRRRELSIRAALGAGASRMVRQLLTESVLLFCAGGILGLATAQIVLRLLLRMAPPELTQLQSTHLDLGMVVFTMAVSGITGLVFGLQPALRASRFNLSDSMKAGTRGIAGRLAAQRFRRLVLVGEMALAVVLLAGAGLLVRSLQHLQEVHLGFETRNTFVAGIQLPATKYAEDTQAANFFGRLTGELDRAPGIQSASGITTLLLDRLPNSTIFRIEGRADPIYTPLTVDAVTPNFFAAVRIPLLRGRYFDAGDRAGALPVVIINAATANRYWPNEDPIGKRFTFNVSGGGAVGPWLTVVGVVADTRRAGVDRPVFTESYFPLAQAPDREMDIVIRADGGAAQARAALSAVLHNLDKDQPIATFAKLDAALGERVASRRFTAWLLSLFAAAALCISGVGLYGLISFLVAQRRNEFGLRVALGAQPRDILRLVLGQVMTLGAIGLAIGLGCALALSRALSALLFGISRFDPGSYVLACIALAAICLAAAIPPARRALRADPVKSLQSE